MSRGSGPGQTPPVRIYYTPEEVAAIFKVKPMTVREWLRNGLLKGIKVGHSWRISEASLKKFEELS